VFYFRYINLVPDLVSNRLINRLTIASFVGRCILPSRDQALQPLVLSGFPGFARLLARLVLRPICIRPAQGRVKRDEQEARGEEKMSNGWHHAEELAEKVESASDGLFVKLANDGDKVVGAFVGEPYAREVHWSGERYVSCLGEGCSFCESGKKPSLRVSINFFQLPEHSLKIAEGGIVWFKDLVKVREKYGLDTWIL
jgi:hypothetical protein